MPRSEYELRAGAAALEAMMRLEEEQPAPNGRKMVASILASLEGQYAMPQVGLCAEIARGIVEALRSDPKLFGSLASACAGAMIRELRNERGREVVASIREDGVEVTLGKGSLQLTPSELVTARHRALITAHADVVLPILLERSRVEEPSHAR